MVHCAECGRKITGNPLRCNRCKKDFCQNCISFNSHHCIRTVVIPENVDLRANIYNPKPNKSAKKTYPREKRKPFSRPYKRRISHSSNVIGWTFGIIFGMLIVAVLLPASPLHPVADILGQLNPSYILRPTVNSPELEQQIHTLVNQYRNDNGLKSLSFDSKLASIARDHSQDMADRNYFSHSTPEGKDSTNRASSVGYPTTKNFGSYYSQGIAENIFKNNLFSKITYYNGIPVYDWNTQDQIALSTVNGWMGSPGHRQNILTARYDREGIGVAISKNGTVYITQDFY